ncbi:MAG TPA: aryl-sulfate sulfotransferase [Planctomycetota bacterium]|nr:aryl-sulfate sulfotransferase [Planctomycetota bacterium]
MLSTMNLSFLASCVALPLCISAAAQEPQGSPDPPRGLRIREEGAFEGYTLLSPLRSGTSYLIDMEGQVVHRWETGRAPGNLAYLLDDGRLLRPVRVEDNPVFFGGGIGGGVQELDWEGNLTWDFTFSSKERIHHHDVEPMPNGHVLLIAWEHVSPEQAIALGRDPEVVDANGWWPDAIYEIEPVRPDGGRIVWEWHALDHLVQDRDEGKPGHGSVGKHPGRIDINGDHTAERPQTAEERRRERELRERMAKLGYAGGRDDADARPPDQRGRRNHADWLHTNSVDYHPGHDLILLSTPRMSEVWVLDHSTTTEEARGASGGRRGKGGEILYRWGNPRVYGAGGEADRRLFAQHDAQWIPEGHPGAGNVLVFNNGNGRPGGEHSSVDEIALPFDPEKGFRREEAAPYGPRELAWSYSAPEPASFYSFFISGAQRLPNGNTLICSGAQGRVFEVTRAGRIVWEYWNPHGGDIPASFGGAAPEQPSRVDPKALFRATRIPADHPGLAGRELGG